MKMSEALSRFHETVTGACTRFPDELPEWGLGYAESRQLLLDDWARVKALVRKDHEQASLIETLIRDALESFDRGEREPGRSTMVRVYNILDQEPLC